MKTRLEFAQEHGLPQGAKLVPVAWPVTAHRADGFLDVSMPYVVGYGRIQRHRATIAKPAGFADGDTHVIVFRGEVVGTICAF